MPTKDIWVALYNTSNYDWDWTTQVGYNGCKVTSKSDNSKSIFLPAAGYVNTWFNRVGTAGYYWIGTARSRTEANNLNFFRSNDNPPRNYDRYYGISVRPVRLVAVNP